MSSENYQSVAHKWGSTVVVCLSLILETRMACLDLFSLADARKPWVASKDVGTAAQLSSSSLLGVTRGIQPCPKRTYPQRHVASGFP